jgi:hypothetical protein
MPEFPYTPNVYFMRAKVYRIHEGGGKKKKIFATEECQTQDLWYRLPVNIHII